MGENRFEPRWLQAYVGSNLEELLDHEAVLKSLDFDAVENTDTCSKRAQGTHREVGSCAMLYNEFVCLNQIISTSDLFSSIVVFAIVVAGALVGISTYPIQARMSIFYILDLVVQCIFSYDVFVKILAEGRYPYLFW